MEYRFLTAGECCITVSFGNEISIELNTKVRMLKNELDENPIEGVVETVPTYCTLSVHYKPDVIRCAELKEKLRSSIARMKPSEETTGTLKEVPVYYGGVTGPDLEDCAKLEGISTQEIIRKHSEHEYYVYQLGFSPGHPYMARSEEPFSFKRMETPRVDIPAHSVVAQVNLTNITPFHQPSGWNILGSTPLNITDYTKDDPFFFKAGDRVKLKPIDKQEYDRIKAEQEREADERRRCIFGKTDGSNVKITVENAGFLTTIQDEGRTGFQASGVSPAGPMDHRSFHIANIIVGNEIGAPALEATITGPVLRFSEDTSIAVTGADLSPKLNGRPVQMYRSIRITAGDVLSFGKRNYGCRTYIAFAGGLKETEIMGSCATDIKNTLGGHEGRALKAGDEIYADANTGSGKNIEMPAEVFNDRDITVRVVLGPQDDRFTRRGIRRFLNYSAVVTDQCDRQGIRLDREPLEFVTDCNIISDGISFGAVQVAGDGKPIILLADRQSVGGYTKIANVIYADLPKLAQVMPGCRIRFVEVSVELAEELYIREIETLVKAREEYVQYRS